MKKVLYLFVFLIVYTGSYGQVRMCIEKTAVNTAPHGAGSYVFQSDFQWDNGAILNVVFSNGSSFLRNKVIKYAQVWEKYANIHFNFEQNAKPDILIEFSNDQASWSQIGRQSLYNTRQGIASMHYGWFNEYSEEIEFQRTILHEFGHALGLNHEHQCANSTIKWNKPLAYNYYYKTNGWLPAEVDQQVFNHYSVTLSNGTYDPQSIMHYPIPAELTLDHKGVGWNTGLSAGDRKIISEKYPKTFTKVPSTDTLSGIVVKPSASVFNIKTTHNVTRNGVNGMEVAANFNIWDAKNKNCIAGIYFFTHDAKRVPAMDVKYQTNTGDACSVEKFTPAYSNTKFENYRLFFPYNQFKIKNGESKLKLLFVVWDDNKNEIARSAYSYFTMRNGPICKKIDLSIQDEVENQRMYIIPKFTVENALKLNCQAKVYFCDAGGNFLKKDDGSVLAYSQYFTPSYDAAAYNSGYYSDLYMEVPYQDLVPFIGNNTVIKYFVRLFFNNEAFAQSDWGETMLSR
ncbi:M12 family metallopeptidase [Chitinophaga sp. HK235]|uniref:M12 family metallopeptidase n=1 Tax=Chitinophaga sp. HK235 TaxID=2952571 RepID=UPI001BAE2AF1|nr:M12 family metallopeptidase [Chitinophaga sp. HK235]